MRFDASLKLYDQALKFIPMGTSTFSRNPNLFVIGSSPLFIDHAKGCRVYDVDGNEFIDYSMALGVINLGYANQEVNDAVKQGIDDGLVFTLACPEESMLAEKLNEIIPCADMVRFSKNGSDVCEAAVRLARQYTKKLKIMTVGGYHGFHDWFIASSPRNKGIPQTMTDWVLPCDYNDIAGIEKTIRERSGEIAALMMEPVISVEPQAGFLKHIRALTAENNIVLVFDEMKTGFRLALGGAQSYFDVTPDIACFAKGIANGFPLSAIAGKKYLMEQFCDEQCFFSASYATEKSGLKAGLKTIEILQKGGVIEHIWKVGSVLKDGISGLINKHKLGQVLKIVGYAPMSHIVFSGQPDVSVNEIKSYIQQECIKRGVLFVGYHHPSFAHKQEDIERTLEVYDEAFFLLSKALIEKKIKSFIVGKPISAFGVRK